MTKAIITLQQKLLFMTLQEQQKGNPNEYGFPLMLLHLLKNLLD